jgi:hypothetical protein
MEVLPELEAPFRTTTGATHSTVPGRESDTHADRVRRNRRLVNTQNARSSEAMPRPGCGADRRLRARARKGPGRPLTIGLR